MNHANSPPLTPFELLLRRELEGEFVRMANEWFFRWYSINIQGMSVDVDNFYGGRIRTGGVVFRGQIQQIYWQSVDRYLVELVHEKFRRWQDAVDNYPSEFRGPSLKRMTDQLRGFVARICQHAVETDRRLRGGGRPEDVQPYSASGVHSSANAEILRLEQACGATLEEVTVCGVNAPAHARGSFIPAGNAFDAFASLSTILGSATKEALIVDPYMDEKVLTDFAVLLQETVQIKLLSDVGTVKPSLSPAVKKWKAQYTVTRALDARLAPARTLHDRLVIVDSKEAWVLTQSLNAFAQRSPASIVNVDPETAQLKVAAYDQMFASAAPLSQ